jgi:hypothetical protein
MLDEPTIEDASADDDPGRELEAAMRLVGAIELDVTT